jgi:putative transposase
MQQELDKNTNISEIPRMQRRPQVKPLVYYVGLFKDKKRGIVEAYQTGVYIMNEIAAQFEVHCSTVQSCTGSG